MALLNVLRYNAKFPHKQKDNDMYDTTIAAKLLKQFEAFMGSVMSSSKRKNYLRLVLKFIG